MKTNITGVSSFVATLLDLYRKYPTIKNVADRLKYERTQSKHFPFILLIFATGLMTMQIVGVIAITVEKAALPGLSAILMQIVVIDLLMLILGLYIYRLQGELRSKPSPAVRSQIYRKFTICGFFPTMLFILSPLSIPKTHAFAEVSDINRLFFTVAQLHFSTWACGSMACKFSFMTLFNLGYNVLAVLTGGSTILIGLRIAVPIGVCGAFILAMDAYMKQNFLLKLAMRRQKDMYQNFLEETQDPVVILNRSRLLLLNKAAADSVLKITRENYAEKFTSLRLDSIWTLQDVVRESLSNSSSRDGNKIRQDQYYMESESKKKTVLKVSVLESADPMSPGERTVSVMLHDITQELKRQEKKDQEKYKKMILFSLSHELRTPLNIFQGFLVESKKFIHTEDMNMIRREAKGAWRYLRNKISDILDYAQIISGEFSLHMGNFSLKRFMNYLMKTTSFQLGSKRKTVSLDFRVEPNVPDLYSGDRDRLEQVLFNFLSNAVKFTEKGKISLLISAAVDEGPVQRKHLYPQAIASGLTFAVSDTGCGMGEDTVTSLFEARKDERKGSSESLAAGSPRIQARNATKLSGLGLTVSKMVCAEMGANIVVWSEMGKGSRFAFTVPGWCHYTRRRVRQRRDEEAIPDEIDSVVGKNALRDSTMETASGLSSGSRSKILRKHTNSIAIEGQAKATATAKPDATTPPAKPTTARIALVVDDNGFNRYVAEQMLKKCGFDTVAAENGKEAIEKLGAIQHEHPCLVPLVFMDVDMPVMDGIQATLRIRQTNARPRPKIIALTAFSAETERRKCFDAGMDHFIDKPLTKDRLCEFLQNYAAETVEPGAAAAAAAGRRISRVSRIGTGTNTTGGADS